MSLRRAIVLAVASLSGADSAVAFDGFGQVVDTPGSVTVTIQSTSEIDGDLNYPVQNVGSWTVALTVLEQDGFVFTPDELRIFGTITHAGATAASISVSIRATDFPGGGGSVSLLQCRAHAPGGVDYLTGLVQVSKSGNFDIDQYDATIVVTHATTGVVYCTAKTNSAGCVPTIATPSGWPKIGATNFFVTATNVLNGKNGLYFYGTQGRASLPFLGGTLCTLPPLKRTPIQNAGGTPPPAVDCSGLFFLDVSLWATSGADPNLTIGSSMYGQFWSRDPAIADGTGVGLTDAVELFVCL